MIRFKNLISRYQSIIQEYPGIVKIGENFNWLVLDTFTRFAFGLLVGAWVARYLGPSQYGLLTFCQVVASMIAVLPVLGMDSILQREIIRYPQKENELLGSAYGIRLVVSILVYIVYFFGIFVWVKDSLTQKMLIIVGIVILNVAPRVILNWFQANLLGKYTMLAQNGTLAILSIARIGCILSKKPLFWFAILIVAEQVFNVIALLFLYKSKGGDIQKWNFSFQRAKGIIKESWPLLISGLSVLIYMQSDQIMLKIMLDNQAVGIYSSAVRISTIFYFIPAALSASLFPTIVRTKAASKEQYFERLQMLYDVNSLFGYFISIPLFLMAPWIIGILFGDSYLDAIPILRIHIWSMIFVFLGMARESFIIAEGHIKYSALITVSFASLNVLLNFVLIPILGGKGAAIATLISYGGSALMSSFFVSYMRQNGIMQLKSLIIFGRLKEYIRNDKEF